MTGSDRRADPYEIRARELCTAAGIDPESRIAKAGSEKTMPAWCSYREPARQEHIERELLSFASARSQDKQYRDAPLKVFGTDHGLTTLQQMKACMGVGNVTGGVLCADGHLGYAQPVGAVIAYEDQVSISGVGFDISCGNMAVRLSIPYDSVKDKASALAKEIAKTISFGIGRTNDVKVEHELFDDEEAWQASGMKDYKGKASAQLGTVGSGNHYVDLFVDQFNYVWIGVHFGSRGLGHSSATKYLKAAGGKDGMNVPPTVIDVGSEIGTRYLAAMHLAGRYAYAGREWVTERVRQIVGGSVLHTVHNHHNYAWLEKHHGKDLWVVRKGATPAFPGQEGFVGGSMGDNAVIIKGVDTTESREALYSTIHGAGRLFGRKEAKRRFTRQEMDEWLIRERVCLVGGDLDESPMAYRRLDNVLDNHKNTINVLYKLRPFVVVMAGRGELDPWKD